MGKEQLSKKLELFQRGLNKHTIDWDFVFNEDNLSIERVGAIEMLTKRGFVTLPVWQGKIQPSDCGLFRVDERRIGASYNRNPNWYDHSWYFTDKKSAKSYSDYLLDKSHLYCLVSQGLECGD
jgi:hypothetical protein